MRRAASAGRGQSGGVGEGGGVSLGGVGQPPCEIENYAYSQTMNSIQDVELYWTKVAAIGQVAGAVATFLAVVISLYLARDSRRPRAAVRVGERLIIGGQMDLEVLMFSIANVGIRPIHVRSVGWRTGFFRMGPRCLRQQHAIQLTGGVIGFPEPPFEVAPGTEISTYCLMSNIIQRCEDNSERPFFSRDFPIVGRRRVPVRGLVHTAEGRTFSVRAEPGLIARLASAEKQAAIEAV